MQKKGDLWLWSSCLLNLDPAHRDSGNSGFASVRHWSETQNETDQQNLLNKRKRENGKEEAEPTCTMPLMTWGSMLRGNLRMLKSDSDTKAFSASSTLFSSTVTNTANVVKATWKHSDKQAAHTSRSVRLG